jgi:putative FmdB family regulatory protein
MPIYEYECDQCGQSFEKMVRFYETDRLPVCPNCSSQATHKKISLVNSLGGSGLGSTGSSGSSCASRGSFT